MSSNIDPSKPGTGSARTSDVRSNFGIAASEISTLQNRVAALEAQIIQAQTPTHIVRISAENPTLNDAVANGAVLRFDTISIDTAGFAPLTSPFDTITIPPELGGVYMLVSWSSGSGTQSTTLGMGILINGTHVFSESNQSISGPQSVNYTLDNRAFEIGRLSSGDTVQLINNSVSAGTNVFRSTTMSLVRIGD